MTETLKLDNGAVVDAGDIACALITTPADIAAIAGEWDHLLDASGCNRAFSSRAWYRAACTAYPGIEPTVIVARADGHPVGILPLVFDTGTGQGRFPTPLADYSDAIVAVDDIPVAVLMLRYALSAGMPWDGLMLNFVREDSNVMRGMMESGLPHRIEWHANERWTCAYQELPARYDDFLASRSRNFRKGIGRARRAAALAGLMVEELTPDLLNPDDLPGIFLRLHGDRFPESSLLSGSHQLFLESVLPSLFAERRLLVFAMRRGDAILAIDLCMVGARSLCTWNGGFDSAVEELSPGRLIIDAGIRSACGRGCAEYDMMRGLEPYKLEWAGSRRLLGKVMIGEHYQNGEA
ncbi:MAG: GNAT family N-acetyltransferase [Candidatus Kapaibacterium sp.]